jgi:Domain of unknown function (DUF4126)
MGTFGLLLGSGWASGINLYLVTVLLGIASRLGWGGVPEAFGRTEVMVIAGVLFAVEFVVDKVPYLDSMWDTAHTVIRPIGAAVIGALLTGDTTSIVTAVGAVISGALALNAHAAKASTRVVVNTSPEPVSNIALSLFEDVSVAGLMALALTFPVITAIVVLVLVVSAGALTIWLFRKVRGAWRGVRSRFGAMRS